MLLLIEFLIVLTDLVFENCNPTQIHRIVAAVVECPNIAIRTSASTVLLAVGRYYDNLYLNALGAADCTYDVLFAPTTLL